MKSVAIRGACLLVLLQATAARAEIVVFRGGTVIDATDGPARRGVSLVVRDGWISAILVASDPIPRNARIIDARGRYLIPGLWDMHVHQYYDPLVPKVYFPLYIANGVLGVRDMFGDCEMANCDGYSIATIHRWQREIAAGRMNGPQILASSALMDGRKPWWPPATVVTDEPAGRAAVVRENARGVDLIKTYNNLSHDAFAGIAAECRRLGLPFGGHIPFAVDAIEASDAGMVSVEHLAGFALSASTERDRYRSELVIAALEGVPAIERARSSQDEFATYDPARGAAIIDAYRRNHTVQVPTLVTIGSHTREGTTAGRDDVRKEYLPRGLVEQWIKSERTGEAAQRYRAKQASRLAFTQRIVAAMDRAEVPIVAGTDLVVPWIYPGFSLHDELAMLAAAGLSPLHALQAATRNAASLARDRDGGTLEVGKKAEIVMLDADPLADIANTRRITGVYHRSQWHDRRALDGMLSSAKAFSATYAPNPAPWADAGDEP